VMLPTGVMLMPGVMSPTRVMSPTGVILPTGIVTHGCGVKESMAGSYGDRRAAEKWHWRLSKGALVIPQG
jgi:hypothetical protein